VPELEEAYDARGCRAMSRARYGSCPWDYRRGDALVAQNVDPRTVQRFWRKTEPHVASDCILWMGSLNGDGYGEIKLTGSRRNVYVHRLAYVLRFGKLEAELTIDHTCETRACVNPFHLEAVSRAENGLRATHRPADESEPVL
jgi:hypothetical protein